jgi:hypothetical protein
MQTLKSTKEINPQTLEVILNYYARSVSQWLIIRQQNNIKLAFKRSTYLYHDIKQDYAKYWNQNFTLPLLIDHRLNDLGARTKNLRI